MVYTRGAASLLLQMYLRPIFGSKVYEGSHTYEKNNYNLFCCTYSSNDWNVGIRVKFFPNLHCFTTVTVYFTGFN